VCKRGDRIINFPSCYTFQRDHGGTPSTPVDMWTLGGPVSRLTEAPISPRLTQQLPLADWPTSLDVPLSARSPIPDVPPAVDRKACPVYSGVLKYFPDAIREVAECSLKGNEQHHPGTPLHWDRSKSTDDADALARHLIDAGTLDTDGIRHSAKVAWRALALLQKEVEARG